VPSYPIALLVIPKRERTPVQDKTHAKAALIRAKQNGIKEEQMKGSDAVHKRYPQIKSSDYFMAMIGLAFSTNLVYSQDEPNK